jgi:hypothetical protein
MLSNPTTAHDGASHACGAKHKYLPRYHTTCYTRPARGADKQLSALVTCGAVIRACADKSMHMPCAR